VFTNSAKRENPSLETSRFTGDGDVSRVPERPRGLKSGSPTFLEHTPRARPWSFGFAGAFVCRRGEPAARGLAHPGLDSVSSEHRCVSLDCPENLTGNLIPLRPMSGANPTPRLCVRPTVHEAMECTGDRWNRYKAARDRTPRRHMQSAPAGASLFPRRGGGMRGRG
jgi:hypothetical protein